MDAFWQLNLHRVINGGNQFFTLMAYLGKVFCTVVFMSQCSSYAVLFPCVSKLKKYSTCHAVLIHGFQFSMIFPQCSPEKNADVPLLTKIELCSILMCAPQQFPVQNHGVMGSSLQNTSNKKQTMNESVVPGRPFFSEDEDTRVGHLFLVVKTRAGFDPWVHIHGYPLVICYIAMENHHF